MQSAADVDAATRRHTAFRRRRDVPPCAECRRLKTKCDRNWPCAHCVRRGYADVCPEGVTVDLASTTNAPVPRPRARTDRDEDVGPVDGLDVSALLERVRELEKALAASAGSAHPLLVDVPTTATATAQARQSVSAGSSESDQGTRHEESYITGAPRSVPLDPVLLPVPLDDHLLNPDMDMEYLLELGSNFPMALDVGELDDPDRAIRQIQALLPPLSEADRLTTAFYEGFGHKIPAIPQDVFARRLHDVYAAQVHNDLESVHMLGLVFVALALGRFRGGEDHDTFFDLAKALFSIQPSVESTSDITVHGLFLMAMYCRLTNRASAAWVTSGLVARLVVANNFHHDPTRWGIDGERAAYWRSTFWEVYSIDMIYSLTVQRAPAFNIRYVDCKMPELEIDSPDLITRTNANYHLWMYRFTSEVLPGVLEQTCGKGQTVYTTVLELDRIVRESWVPPSLQPDRTNAVKDAGPPDAPIQRFIILWYREFTLMALHRTPLELALAETSVFGASGDVMAHQCAPSVLAAFRSACTLGRAMCAITRHAAPRLRACHPYFWQAGFAATTVLGALALMAPHCSVGPVARTEALVLCDLYESDCLGIPARVRSWLRRLKRKLMDNCNDPVASVVQGAPEWDAFGPDETAMAKRSAPGRPAMVATQTLNASKLVLPDVSLSQDSMTLDHHFGQLQTGIEPDVTYQWENVLRMLGLPVEDP